MELRDLIYNDYIRRGTAPGNSNGWLNVRCPFCGDSSNPKKAHMYIKPPTADNPCIVIKCFKPECDTSRIMRVDDAIKMGITDINIYNYIRQSYSKGRAIISKRVESFTDIEYDADSDSLHSEAKKYFLHRTARELTKELIDDFHVISDIRSLNLYVSEEVFKSYRWRLLCNNKDSYIAFYSRGVVYIRYFKPIRRNKDKEIIKHEKVPLDSVLEYNVNFYNAGVLPGEFTYKTPFVAGENVIAPEVQYQSYKNVYVGEGIFDAVNTRLHYSEGDNKDNLHAATGSISAFKGVLRYLTRHFYDSNFIWVKDSDVSLDYIHYVFNSMGYRFSKRYIEVLYNMLDKDLGDKSKPIELAKISIF